MGNQCKYFENMLQQYLVLKEQSSFYRKKSGDDGAVDTPVPIPNTEVKHRSGEDILYNEHLGGL